MFSKHLAAAAALGLFGTSAFAGVIVNSGSPVVLDFDSSVTGVYRFSGDPAANGSVIAEPTNWAAQGESGRFAFLSQSWHITSPNQGVGKFPTPFSSDIDNNGATDGRFDFFAQEGAVKASPAGGAGNYAFTFTENQWADRILTLKIDNNTGATVTDWTLGVDSWFSDTGKGIASLGLYYGTAWQDNAAGLSPGNTFTLLDSRAGTNTNAGLSALENIGGSFSAAVPDGGSLYVKFFYDQNGGGTEFSMDNISVTAVVPEPGTLSILGLGALAALRRRRA